MYVYSTAKKLGFYFVNYIVKAGIFIVGLLGNKIIPVIVSCYNEIHRRSQRLQRIAN